MSTVAPRATWSVEFDRGPEWLFARLIFPLSADPGGFRLAETIFQAMEQQFVQRVVVEMEQVEAFRSVLIGQIVLLHKRIASQGGLLRLSGMSQRHIEAIRIAGLEERFPAYENREQAVMGRRPVKPR